MSTAVRCDVCYQREIAIEKVVDRHSFGRLCIIHLILSVSRANIDNKEAVFCVHPSFLTHLRYSVVHPSSTLASPPWVLMHRSRSSHAALTHYLLCRIHSIHRYLWIFIRAKTTFKVPSLSSLGHTSFLHHFWFYWIFRHVRITDRFFDV